MLSLYLTLLESDEDEDKFILVYNKYKNLMFKEAYSYIKDYNLSEDCIQSAFMEIARCFDRIGEVESPETKAYVMTITRVCAFRIYNDERKNVTEPIDDFELLPDSSAADDMIDKTEVSLVTETVSDLPERYRDVLILRFAYDYDYEHMARLLGISPSAVRKRVERAKKVLARELDLQVVS